jgi:hypothetical protein
MSVIVGRPKSEVEERSNIIRLDFNKRYNLEELREQLLYREQAEICEICKRWVQDSSGVICVVDHATSIYIFASWNGSIEEACEHANALKNLVAVHTWCNASKNAQDLEEFLEQIEAGEIVLGEAPTLTEKRIQELRDQLSERSSKGWSQGC